MYSNGFPTKPHACDARLLFGAMLMAQRSSSFEIRRGCGRGLLLDRVAGSWSWDGRITSRWDAGVRAFLATYVTVGVLDKVGR